MRDVVFGTRGVDRALGPALASQGLLPEVIHAPGLTWVRTSNFNFSYFIPELINLTNFLSY